MGEIESESVERAIEIRQSSEEDTLTGMGKRSVMLRFPSLDIGGKPYAARL